LANDNPSFLSRNQFLFYRLFSLFGLIPVGAYMCVHLLTNVTVVNGALAFQKNVDVIHSLGVALPAVEWIFIFIPLIFHAVMGMIIVSSGSFNTASYPLTRNFRYTLQRATGMIAFVFILFHVLQLHHMGSVFGGGRFDAEHAASSTAIALSPAVIKALYIVGVLACVYHLANGIWTFGITWGIWTGKTAQTKASYACLAFGLALACVSVMTVGAFGNLDTEKAKEIETRHQQTIQAELGVAPADEKNGPDKK
jgi:succinate dehydrogenase / fumarate reductase cytochrome b subunit